MKFLFAFVVCAFAVAVNCQTDDNDWKEYKVYYTKIFSFILLSYYLMDFLDEEKTRKRLQGNR